MPQGDKGKHTDEQKRHAERIADSYEHRSVSERKQTVARGLRSTRSQAAARSLATGAERRTTRWGKRVEESDAGTSLARREAV